jgi:hypothetical protein
VFQAVSIFLLFTISVAGFFPALAQQRHLSVYNAKGTLVKRFYEGEAIIFKSDAGWHSSLIAKLESDTLYFDEGKLHLNKISAVRIIKQGRSGTGGTLMIAGLLWPAIVTINGISSDSRPLLTNRSLISTAALLGGGGLLMASAIRTYSTTEAGRLRILNFDFKPSHSPSHDTKTP